MSSSSIKPLPLARVAFVGAIVPATFIVLDLWLIDRMSTPGRDDVAAALALGVFVVQIGVLSILCGRFVEPHWLRWLIYGWGFLSVDIIVMMMSVADSTLPGNTKSLLMTSLVNAQLGLVTVWAFLGTTQGVIRWPAALVLISLLCVPLSGMRNHIEFAPLFVAQYAALFAICIILRKRRFRIIAAEPESPTTDNSSSRGQRRMQFGVRDLMIWTASLAVILAVARALDLLSPIKIAALLGKHSIMVTSGTLSAIVLIVALWAALGEGNARLRWSLLAIFAPVGGMVFAVLDWRATNARYWPNNWWFSFWTPSYRRDYYHEEWHLIAWFCLAGALLFASLLIFRTLGFRLSRESTPASTA